MGGKNRGKEGEERGRGQRKGKIRRNGGMTDWKKGCQERGHNRRKKGKGKSQKNEKERRGLRGGMKNWKEVLEGGRVGWGRGMSGDVRGSRLVDNIDWSQRGL